MFSYRHLYFVEGALLSVRDSKGDAYNRQFFGLKECGYA